MLFTSVSCRDLLCCQRSTIDREFVNIAVAVPVSESPAQVNSCLLTGRQIVHPVLGLLAFILSYLLFPIQIQLDPLLIPGYNHMMPFIWFPVNNTALGAGSHAYPSFPTATA